jgi:hypothetical protein
MKTPMLMAGLGAVIGLAGCATPPESGAQATVAGERAPAAGAAGETYREFEYSWRDAAFYRDWYDASAFVLPPPAGAVGRSGVKAAAGGADAATLREVDFDGAKTGGK